jgi:hypothetical protein
MDTEHTAADITPEQHAHWMKVTDEMHAEFVELMLRYVTELQDGGFPLKHAISALYSKTNHLTGKMVATAYGLPEAYWDKFEDTVIQDVIVETLNTMVQRVWAFTLSCHQKDGN